MIILKVYIAIDEILKVYIAIDDCCVNKLDPATKGTKCFGNPQVLSSVLAVLGMLQPY